MRKLPLVLLLYVLACIGREVFDYFETRLQAYRAYQSQASVLAKERRHQAPFDSIDGYIVDILYRLDSIERSTEHEVRIVAVQSVHFQRGLSVGNWGGRRIARTEHRAVMRRHGRDWQICVLHEGSTEVADLGNVVVAS